MFYLNMPTCFSQYSVRFFNFDIKVHYCFLGTFPRVHVRNCMIDLLSTFFEIPKQDQGIFVTA